MNEMKSPKKHPLPHTHITAVKSAYMQWLLSLDDVHTAAIGYKTIKGIPTKDLAIVVFTSNKKQPNQIPPHQCIPPFLAGFPTDVIESSEFTPYQQTGMPLINRQKLRPIPGGAEIYMPNSPFTGGLCTLGMFARSTRAQDDPNDIYLLANAHCFPRGDQAIFQPETHEPQDRIAYATRIVNSSLVDGGIAQLLKNDLADTSEIIGIGTVLGRYEADLSDIGKSVIKSGRTTGVTIGTIAYLHADADDKKDQLIVTDIDTAFSDHGDSGSVVLMNQGERWHYVTALLWGGALNFTVCSPIIPVCEELQIDLITAENQ